MEDSPELETGGPGELSAGQEFQSLNPAGRRAEEMVDDLAQAVAGWTARFGHWLLKETAVLREEAEDIWAEAQSRARDGDQKT